MSDSEKLLKEKLRNYGFTHSLKLWEKLCEDDKSEGELKKLISDRYLIAKQKPIEPNEIVEKVSMVNVDYVREILDAAKKEFLALTEDPWGRDVAIESKSMAILKWFEKWFGKP
jgi:hypothetical protein